jgi:hypothetical protein
VAPTADYASWKAVDLAQVIDGENNLSPSPAMLGRSDGEHLLYAGKIHSLAGEPESGKGWLILHAAQERLTADEHVLYIDFEDEARTVVGRLRNLGVDKGAITGRFHYLRPDEPLTEPGRVEVERLLDTYRPTLAVIDGMTDALALHGIDLRDNTEIAEWMRDLPTTLRNRGLAVVITDHVTKDTESRGRYAIGAQHKLAKVDVAYRLHVDVPLGRGLTGRVLIRVEKDRPGHVRPLANGKAVGTMVAVGSEGGAVAISIEPLAEGEAGAAGFRPTVLMEKISRVLEVEEGLSLRAVRTAVSGTAEYKDRALEVLIREDYVEMRRDGQAQRHFSIRPYREDEDPNRVPDRVPTVSPSDQGDHSRDRVPVSPLIRDTGHGHSGTVSHDRVPSLPDPVGMYAPPCKCVLPADRTSDGKCSRCFGWPEGKVAA